MRNPRFRAKATQEEPELGWDSMGSGEAERLVPGSGPQGQTGLFALAFEGTDRGGIVASLGNKGSSLPSCLPLQTLCVWVSVPIWGVRGVFT